MERYFFKNRWITNGIIYLYDVFENGMFRKFTYFEEKLGKSGDLYLEYELVKAATKNLNYDGTKDDFQIYFHHRPLSKLKSKQIRQLLAHRLESSEETHVIGNFIKKNYTDIQDSSNIWRATLECTCETRLVVLQWKILHNIYPTKILLEKFGKTGSNLCEHCNIVDTLEHFFFHCLLVRPIWSEVEKDLNGYKLTVREVMLGVPPKQNEAKKTNLLILIGKLVISKFKYGDYPNIRLLYEQEKQLRRC